MSKGTAGLAAYLLVLAVAVFAFFQSENRRFDIDDHREFAGSLLVLRQLDAALDREVLLARSGRIDAADGVVAVTATTAAINRTLARLKDLATGFDASGAVRFKAMVADLQRAFETKIAAVDRVWQRHQDVETRKRSLSRRLTAAAQQADVARARDFYALVFALHAFVEDPWSDSHPAVGETLARLAQGDDAPLFEGLHTQVAQLVEQRLALEHALAGFFAAPVPDEISRLTSAYQDFHAHHMQGSDRQRHLMAGIVTLLLVGLAVIMWRLRATRQAAERASRRLRDAIESASEGMALYDVNDRLISWNKRFLHLFPSNRHLINEGITFETLVRAQAQSGDIVEARSDPEGWAARRIARHRTPKGMFEIEVAGGRCLEVRERRTETGGVVATYTDVSDRKWAEHELAEKTALVDLMHAVAASANAAGNEAEALSEALQTLCAFNSWPLGHVYRVSKDGETLEPAAIWYPQHPAGFGAVRTALESRQVRRGADAAGKVLDSRRAQWSSDISPDDRVRSLATAAGLAGSYALPVMVGDDVAAVLAFYTKDSRPPDSDLLVLLGHIGTQVGRAVERARTAETLRKLSLAVEQSPAAVIITDPEGVIEYVNPTFTAKTGFTAQEAIGKTPSIVSSGHTPRETYEDMWRTISQGREWRGEFNNRRKDGTTFWELAVVSPIIDEQGTVTHFLAIKEDITERRHYEERLLHQANYDDLTELPNRLLAIDRLSQALASAHRSGNAVAVLFINLDELKKVNDTLGHAAGDQLLRETGQRLSAAVRDGDTVARMGGDEFLVVAPTLDDPASAESAARRIVEVCARPFMLDGNEVVVTARVGVTLAPTDGDDPHVLLRNAHAAATNARELGGNTYRFFTPALNIQAQERLEMEALLRHALERDELRLVYQPVVRTADHTIIGAEALLRWSSPELGNVSPGAFVPLAERTGLIVPIGTWVLETACRQAREWAQQTGVDVRMAVNVSSRQIETGTLLDVVEKALSDSGLAADLLELEVTERLLVDDAPETLTMLRRLSEMGISLSLDDFGTGYSALSYLKRYPFDVLKIDRAFVSGVTRSAEDAALTSAIIAMAHGLGLKVIGEGVEAVDQLDFLRARNCDLVQGFYYSRPVEPSEFRAVIERGLQLIAE